LNLEVIMDDSLAGDINPRRWWVLAILVAAQFMYVVDTFIVNVAIPSIRADLQASTAQIEGVIAIYQIAYASMVITGGRLGDMFGAKRLFLIGLVGFTLTSLACGFAPSANGLIIARLAQGLTALMVPQVLATIHTQRAAVRLQSSESRSGSEERSALCSAAGS
jgi:MFS family permease